MTRNKIRSIFMVFLIVLAIFLGFYCLLRYQQYHAAQSHLKERQLELAKMKAEITKIENSIQDFEKDRNEFKKYLFREQDIPAFLEGISEFANVSDVNIVDMKTTKFRAVERPNRRGDLASRNLKKKNNPQEAQLSVDQMLTLAAMPITVQMKGTYQSFVRFLDQLENFEQLLTISSVKIDAGRDYPILKCDFTLKIYSIKTLNELAKQ